MFNYHILKRIFTKALHGRQEKERFLHGATSQLDNILRAPGVKSILCNRTNNIDFEKALSDGEITFMCTRRGDLGAIGHKAFGTFFILLMQYYILSRPGNEKNRTPHFLYIDEFPDFLNKQTMPIFTMYRKYRVGPTVSAQSLDQFGSKGKDFRQILLGNCVTKLVFGGNTPEENAWWEKEFSVHRDWKFNWDYDMTKLQYDPKPKNVVWGWKEYFEEFKISQVGFKKCIYKTKDLKGKHLVGPGKVDFLESKYKEPAQDKTFNFYRFTSGISEENKKSSTRKKRVLHAEDNNDSDNFDPVQTDTTDSTYFVNSGDGITFDLKPNK